MSEPVMGSRPPECLGPHSSFLGLNLEGPRLDAARAVIVPVPYDGTTTFRSGTREGPRAILSASRELEFFDEETLTEVHENGIATLEELPVVVSSPRDMVERVRLVGDFLLASNKLPVLLGGEHLISLGMIQAAARHFPDLTVLHLDAHSDLRQEYQGSAFSNACVMRHVSEFASLVQVGVRSLSAEEWEWIQHRNIPCYFAGELWRRPSLWEEIPSKLSSHIYLSIDLDVFDPSIMPSVGTPEPGGVGWYEVLSLLRRVIQQHRVVGFDVMELLPIPHLAAPDFLAARLVHKILSYIFLDNPPKDLVSFQRYDNIE